MESIHLVCAVFPSWVKLHFLTFLIFRFNSSFYRGSEMPAAHVFIISRHQSCMLSTSIWFLKIYDDGGIILFCSIFSFFSACQEVKTVVKELPSKRRKKVLFHNLGGLVVLCNIYQTSRLILLCEFTEYRQYWTHYPDPELQFHVTTVSQF